MINLTVKIDGLSELQRSLRLAPAMTVKEVSKAVQKSMLTVQSNAMKEAPVNKQGGGGNLRQSIKSAMVSILRGEVVANAKYAAYVEGGTRPHPIAVINKKVLANKRTGQIFGKLVHHPGTRANPFMARAIEKSREKIVGFFKIAMINVVKSIT